MSTTSQSLSVEYSRLNNVAFIISGKLNMVIAEVKTVPIEEQAAMVARLRDLQELLGSLRKQLNIVTEQAEEALCKTIVNESDDLPYVHELGSFTPTARGFYSINDVSGFVAWLRNNHPEVEPHQTLYELAKSKSAANTFFDDILKGGENLPKCVSKHIVAKVTIRNREQKDLLGVF